MSETQEFRLEEEKVQMKEQQPMEPEQTEQQMQESEQKEFDQGKEKETKGSGMKEEPKEQEKLVEEEEGFGRDVEKEQERQMKGAELEEEEQLSKEKERQEQEKFGERKEELPKEKEQDPTKKKELEGEQQQPSEGQKGGASRVEAGRKAQGELPKTMKAAKLVEFGKPLEFQEVPVPEPGPCEVLVQVTMCGVCHTDVHMRIGDLPSLKPDNLPRTLGHEGVGKVFMTGPGVTRFNVGDRVCLNCVADACMRCENCCDGWVTACMQTKLSSCHTDGHYSQFFLAKEPFLCPIPDGVSDEEAAPLNCGGLTSYKALKVSRLRAGQWVVIVGAAGGLGYYAIQFAKAMGLKVIAVDRGDDKMEFLKKFESMCILDESKDNVTEKVLELTNNKGAHGALVLAPSNEAFEEAPKYLRHRGKLMVVGQPTGSAKFDVTTLVMKTITMIGSMVGTPCDLAEALQFVADGVVKSEPTVRNFDELNDILDEIAELKVTGRNVIRISDPVEPSEAKGGPTELMSRMKERVSSGFKDLYDQRIARHSGVIFNLVWPLLVIILALAAAHAGLQARFFSSKSDS